MQSFTVHTSQIAISTSASNADTAKKIVLDFENAPESAFVAVYQDNPVPPVDARLGAPFGRTSNSLDPEGKWQATALEIDEGGFDQGGAYWGLQKPGNTVFSVQDGLGAIAFVAAATDAAAIACAPRQMPG